MPAMFGKLKDLMWGTKFDDEYSEFDDGESYFEDEPSERYERREVQDRADRYYRPDRADRQEKDRFNSSSSLPQPAKKRFSGEGKVISVPQFDNLGNSRVIISQPKDVEEATTVSNYLSEGFICIINLENVDKPDCQRIADFLGGSCYALHGSVARISREIFVIVPQEVSLSSEMQEELKNKSSLLPKFVAAFK